MLTTLKTPVSEHSRRVIPAKCSHNVGLSSEEYFLIVLSNICYINGVLFRGDKMISNSPMVGNHSPLALVGPWAESKNLADFQS